MNILTSTDIRLLNNLIAAAEAWHQQQSGNGFPGTMVFHCQGVVQAARKMIEESAATAEAERRRRCRRAFDVIEQHRLDFLSVDNQGVVTVATWPAGATVECVGAVPSGSASNCTLTATTYGELFGVALRYEGVVVPVEAPAAPELAEPPKSAESEEF